MAISRFRIAKGFDKVFGDTAPIPGLAYAKFRRSDYLYKPMDQPAARYPQRVIEIKYVPPGAPADEVAPFDFYRGQQTEWTIALTHRVAGVDVIHLYNSIIMETTLVVEDADVTSLITTFMMNAAELEKVLQKAKPGP